ncbi:MAG: efflux RND transporter permease subunit [Bacteroidia bacterium]|nr:efflux RND transporter permease subunit [Bacteroidia bacterium]
MSITELSIRRPLLILVIFTVLGLFGYISYTNLTYNLLPKFEAGVISVNTVYVGASPENVEQNITKPIEDAISTIEGVDIISSRSLENSSAITIQLKSGIDNLVAQQDVERKIGQIKGTLPEDARDPVVNRFSTSQIPVLKLSVTANLNDAQLYQLLDETIIPSLSNTEGVGQISIIGGQPREIQIELNNLLLQANHLSARQVYQVMAASNVALPAGAISNEQERVALQINADLNQLDLLRNLVIKEFPNGSRLLLKDIATVVDGQSSAVTLNRFNGVQAIGLQVSTTNDANAVKVSKLVKDKLVDLKETYSYLGLDYQIASDQSIYTLAAADSVVEDLFLAILIVAGVMLFFLHSLRSSMFVLVAIPTAMIPTFIMMYLFGFSLNLMSLMGLSLVVGILVDDSIVVLENIYRHLEMGKTKREAALDGRNEIGFTAVAITFVDVVVFLPLALTGGLIGNIVREFALVVVTSTLLSLFVAFTLTPMLASRFGKLTELNPKTIWGKINLVFESWIDGLKDAYARALKTLLRYNFLVIGFIFALIVASVYLVPAGFIGASFVGNSDRGELTVILELDPNTPLSQTNLAMKQAEKMMLEHPLVVTVYSLTGTTSGQAGGSSNTTNQGELSVAIVPKEERDISTDEFGLWARNEIEQIPGVKVTVIPTGITGNVSSPIQLVVKGANRDSVETTANLVKQAMIQTPGTDYVAFSTKGASTSLRITPDRDKLAKAGLTVSDLSAALQIGFSGNTNVSFTEDGTEYDINLRLDQQQQQSASDVANMVLVNNSQNNILLGQVAQVEPIVAQQVLERNNRLSSITVTSSAIGRPSGDIVNDIKTKISGIDIPAGVEVDFLGEAKNQQDSFASLGLALLIGIVLVYLIMVALYESLVYPFVVLFSIPVALIGALLALALTMNQLTIFSIVGMIMLLGLVAKNGILIVDFTNQLRAEGNSVREALVEAGKERLRPIMMTTFAMVLGMMPLALSHAAGAEFKNGMAWVLIGGLTSSFLFTLFLVPSVYLVVDFLRVHVNRLVGSSRLVAAEPQEIVD